MLGKKKWKKKWAAENLPVTFKLTNSEFVWATYLWVFAGEKAEYEWKHLNCVWAPDRWREFVVTPSGWKVYLCDLFSGRWNITLGGVLWLSKHGNDSSAVSPWDTPFFQSDRWCFWDVRESWFPPAALNMCTPDFLLAILNLSTLPVCCWWGKKWKYRVCI